LAHSVFTNTYWSSGSIVYYRSAASAGSFTTTSTATDTKSGIVSYAFPALGTNWTSTPGALGVNTYAWSGAPAVPGAQGITATNNANGVSSTSFTPTADDTAPSAGTVSYVDGDTMGTSVTVTFAAGTDSGLGDRDPAAPACLRHPPQRCLWRLRGIHHGHQTAPTRPLRSSTP